MSARRWTEDHGEPGLRRKFAVYKPRDGRLTLTHPGCHVYADSARLGADGEFIFVLRPETDAHAVRALRTYAYCIVQRDPQLARDIHAQLNHIEDANRS